MQLHTTLTINIEGSAPPPTAKLIVTPNPLSIKPNHTETVQVALDDGPLPSGSSIDGTWVGNSYGCATYSPGLGLFSITTPANITAGMQLQLVLTVTLP